MANNNIIILIIIQFIYVCALQQPKKANYSQELKQQYRIKDNIIKSTNDIRDQEVALKNKVTQSKCMSTI
jgi:hypothetical protein